MIKAVVLGLALGTIGGVIFLVRLINDEPDEHRAPIDPGPMELDLWPNYRVLA